MEKVLKSLYAAFWKVALNDEMKFGKLVDITLVLILQGVTGEHFGKELRVYGTIETLKQPLIAKGFTQEKVSIISNLML